MIVQVNLSLCPRTNAPEAEDDTRVSERQPPYLVLVMAGSTYIVAIFYPFSQFCEINVFLLSLQTQPNTAPNLFQRGVEYGKYDV